MLDSRYDALEGGGNWWLLIDDDVWDGPNTSAPVDDGWGGDEMAAVILSGGYSRVPIPRAVHEPPPDIGLGLPSPYPYIDDWCYCWALPYNEDNCFNYPCTGRTMPYDTLQFLSGATSAFLAKDMYDGGNYVNGRYAPGERIIVAVYNSYTCGQWGSVGKEDAAVLAGYFGAIIVGYGNDFDKDCGDQTPGDWQSYVPCVTGSVNTVYGIAALDAPLVIDPSQMIDQWLPKRVELFTPTVPLPVVASAPAQDNLAPYPSHRPAPFDMAMGVSLTSTLSWRGGDPDGDPLTYTVAFGPSDPPPVVATGLLTPTYDPGPLLTNTTYYWAVTATDGLSTTAGLQWEFTTAEEVIEEYYIYLPLVVRG